MFCPKCGQESVSTEKSFCSKCGFLLTGTAELIKNDGVFPAPENSSLSKHRSLRDRGLKQGLFIFLLTFLIAPTLAIIETGNGRQPDAALISGIVLGVGGVLRMAYALMFESAVSGSTQDAVANAEAVPITSEWRNTKELRPSISESTTKPLDQQKRVQ